MKTSLQLKYQQKKNRLNRIFLFALYLTVFSLSPCLSLTSCSDDNTKEENKMPDKKPDTPQDSETTTRTDFSIKRGVNIGNWLSQSELRGAQRSSIFTRSDVEKLSSYGFDHLRLPVDEEQLFHEDGTMDKETITLVHNVIGWCQEKNMKVIFDLHIIISSATGSLRTPQRTGGSQLLPMEHTRQSIHHSNPENRHPKSPCHRSKQLGKCRQHQSVEYPGQ